MSKRRKALRITGKGQKNEHSQTLETRRQAALVFRSKQNKDIDAARAFLREWQGVVAKRLNEDDRRNASRSRELREQEFIQLRADQIKVHNGDLAGKLLVDVLTADLLEAAA